MKKIGRKLLGALLALVMIAGMIPAATFTVHAAHRCPDCEDLIDGSPYCDECYKCDACVDLCLECGKCDECSGNDICEGCSDEESGKMCEACAVEKGSHCPECDGCYFSIQLWCEECGKCADCAEICDNCSVNMGEGILCVDCAADKESHCYGCGGCLFEIQGWCEECGLCFECVVQDEICSEYFGKIICKECASYYDTHCPACDTCYGDSEGWCEECGQCNACSEICNYCCTEAGITICTECAISQGLHCPECSGCYGECGGDSCSQCGICAACAVICYAEELCIECAIAEGYHCPSCEACGDAYVICEGCGEKCIDCADGFCESCNLCGECVMICQDCGSCEECATICPNCEEHCDQCEGICDDCGLCLVCCEDLARMDGCDCDGEWVCVENPDWEEHFDECHTEAPGSHSVRPSAGWNFDSNYHWHDCAYCDAVGHQTSKSAHSYDATGKCSTCYYVKNAKIQIVVQPKDVKHAIVTSSEEDPDARNLAHFSVVAIGNSELTYTWCRQYYEKGQLTYKPLTNPDALENYTGPNLTILAPTDACTGEYYICCFITDEDGNEVKTVDVLLTGIHDYQYYKEWKMHERPYAYAERNQYGHILQCVGDDCGKLTRLRPHEDEDSDGLCDICDYAIGKILITKQPKDSKSAYVWGPYEDYDESNIAHFSVEAEGKSELTYTWCRKQYVKGVLTYVPLTDPEPGENYTGPDLDILVPMDACCNEYTYACIITDEDGNETRTVDVVLKAKHNYQYYKEYISHENPYPDARRRYTAHVLVCVGDDCGKVTRYRQHIDENHDYFCDVCDKQKDFQEINLTVTAPKEGQLPSYTVGTDSVAYFAMGGSNDYTQYRYWLVSDDGVSNWKIIDKTTAFVAGKYYKFIVEMQTGSEYAFPTYNSTPNFWAKVNGDYATVEKTYGKDPAKYVTVTYEFGMCNDSEIENIIIDNVVTPIGGEKPTYTATVRGSGYYINTDKNSYYDDWMNNRELYYIKNGIGWFDMTEYDWVYENETFIPGHQYQVNVYLKTEEGYEFKLSKYLDIEFTATVNGFVAEGVNNNSDCRVQQTITNTFTCEGKKISTVMVNGLAAPRGGENPDYTVSAAYPEWYQPDPNYGGTGGIVWYDSEGNQLLPEDTFVEGKQYKVEIKLISAKLEGANTSQFVSPVDAYINGKQVVTAGDWDMVYGNSGAVYIYYTFPDVAAPRIKKSVSGTVTSFNSATDKVTVQLIPQGLTEPAYETVVTGNSASYNFADVERGIYTLRVSKIGHTTFEDKLTVSNVSVVKDVTIALTQYDVTVTGGTASANKATIGTTVTLTAGKAPSGKVFDKWIVSGVTVANVNSATTTFTMPAGDVTAQATYKNAPITPAKITTQPKTAKVKAGSAAKYTVQATGTGLKYQWQSSSDGKTWKNCSSTSATSTTFKFTAKTSHSSNYYRCKVTDSAGNTVYTDAVRLYVLGITTQPKTLKIKTGTTAKFTVKATGAGKTYQWQSSSDGKTWKNCSSSSATSATFSFASKTSHSSNYYRCVIKDNGGNTVYTDAVRLYVLGITTQPKTQKVEAGEKVKLTVKASGAGKTYQWQSSTDGKTWKNCSSSSATSATFTFTSKISHNGNYYRCRIKDNGGNTVYTDAVRAYVLGITKHPAAKTVNKGKTAKFTVEATGASKTYQWQVSTDGGKTWKNCSSSSAKKATFSFTAKASHNGNYYRCRVKDSGGNTVYTNKVKLTVKK